MYDIVGAEKDGVLVKEVWPKLKSDILTRKHWFDDECKRARQRRE